MASRATAPPRPPVAALPAPLAALRPIAALIVMLSHVSQTALTDGQMEVFAYSGTEAVDVFFVLSGFVIAHVCARGESFFLSITE